MACGITFENNKSVEYYANYFDFLIELTVNIEILRLSISFPSEDRVKDPTQVINNIKLGEKFIVMTKKCLDNFITPNIDCIIYPCMFENKEQFRIATKFAQIPKGRQVTKCLSCPGDIFPDDTTSFCYPLKEAIKFNVDDFETTKEMARAMELKSTLLKEITRHSLPDTCKNCNFYKVNNCEGPCLGFRDLSRVTV